MYDIIIIIINNLFRVENKDNNLGVDEEVFTALDSSPMSCSEWQIGSVSNEILSFFKHIMAVVVCDLGNETLFDMKE